MRGETSRLGPRRRVARRLPLCLALTSSRVPVSNGSLARATAAPRPSPASSPSHLHSPPRPPVPPSLAPSSPPSAAHPEHTRHRPQSRPARTRTRCSTLPRPRPRLSSAPSPLGHLSARASTHADRSLAPSSRAPRAVEQQPAPTCCDLVTLAVAAASRPMRRRGPSADLARLASPSSPLPPSFAARLSLLHRSCARSLLLHLVNTSPGQHADHQMRCTSARSSSRPPPVPTLRLPPGLGLGAVALVHLDSAHSLHPSCRSSVTVLSARCVASEAAGLASVLRALRAGADPRLVTSPPPLARRRASSSRTRPTSSRASMSRPCSTTTCVDRSSNPPKPCLVALSPHLWSSFQRAHLADSCVRQSLHTGRDGHDWRRPVHARPVRHGRPGGLRPAAPALVPADRRLPRLLQRHVAGLVRERQGEVVPRGAPPLPGRALPHRWHPGRPARRPGRPREARQAEAASRPARGRRAARSGTRRRQVRRVLGAHAEGGASPLPLSSSPPRPLA